MPSNASDLRIAVMRLARRLRTERASDTLTPAGNVDPAVSTALTTLATLGITVNPKNDLLPNLASYMADYALEFFRHADAHCRIDLAEPLPPVRPPQCVRPGECSGPRLR